jgi:ABC-type Co2+ transport system permease subunit
VILGCAWRRPFFTKTDCLTQSAIIAANAVPKACGIATDMFVPTQVPLGIAEGFLCVGAYRFIMTRRPELLKIFAV